MRQRNCQLCANHGKIIKVKDHKEICERKFCNCIKCKQILAVRMKRRAQPLTPLPSTSSTPVAPVEQVEQVEQVAEVEVITQGNFFNKMLMLQYYLNISHYLIDFWTIAEEIQSNSIYPLNCLGLIFAVVCATQGNRDEAEELIKQGYFTILLIIVYFSNVYFFYRKQETYCSNNIGICSFCHAT